MGSHAAMWLQARVGSRAPPPRKGELPYYHVAPGPWWHPGSASLLPCCSKLMVEPQLRLPAEASFRDVMWLQGLPRGIMTFNDANAQAYRLCLF
jgi:hypothetical protein